MPTAYVYSPTGGSITGRANYCMFYDEQAQQWRCDNNPCTGDHGDHGECKSYASPVDIGAWDGQDIYLYVNYPTVKSVKTIVAHECCCGGNNEYAQSVEVKLYANINAQCYIGSVLYGHIENPQVGNNQVYNLGGGSLKLGSAPDLSHQCGGFTCYSGSHSHMERSGGSTVAPCCCADTTAGSTPIYSWNVFC